MSEVSAVLQFLARLPYWFGGVTKRAYGSGYSEDMQHKRKQIKRSILG